MPISPQVLMPMPADITGFGQVHIAKPRIQLTDSCFQQSFITSRIYLQKRITNDGIAYVVLPHIDVPNVASAINTLLTAMVNSDQTLQTWTIVHNPRWNKKKTATQSCFYSCSSILTATVPINHVNYTVEVETSGSVFVLYRVTDHGANAWSFVPYNLFKIISNRTPIITPPFYYRNNLKAELKTKEVLQAVTDF
jgi:hypothetical protein